jgi:hypothetical protein
VTTYDGTAPRSSGLALALLATPLLWLVAELVSPELHTDSAAQLAEIARHPDRWYAYTVLLSAGLGTCIAAAVGLGRLAGGRLGRIGMLVLSASLVIAIGDAMTQLMVWQMVEPGADRSQMAALMTRFDEAPGAGAVFGAGGLAYLVGTLLLTVGLARAEGFPVWIALAVGGGLILNVVGFIAASVPVILVSCVVLLVGMGLAGRRLVGPV